MYRCRSAGVQLAPRIAGETPALPFVVPERYQAKRIAHPPMSDEPEANHPRHAAHWSARLGWGLGVVLLAAVVTGLAFLPVAQYYKQLLEWIGRLGLWGPVILVLVYVVVSLAFLPSSALTPGAGFLLGAIWGAVLASLGVTLGATAAFLLARGLLRGRIEHRLASHPKFRRLDRAVAARGFQIVLLARLCSFFPHDLTSYALGLTDISLGRYVLATWLGRLPGTVMFAYLGSTARSLAEVAVGKAAFGAAHQVFLTLGVAAMAAMVILVASVARKALREAVDDSSGPRRD